MSSHTSVLLHRHRQDYPTVMDILAPKPGEHVLDVTLGLGGHASAFLAKVGGQGSLTGIDADVKNLEAAKENLAIFDGQTVFVHANFGEVVGLSLGQFDIIFADLGVSSPHLDDPSRGFMFKSDASLDMRYDKTRGKTAAEILNESTEQEIADIFYKFGEVKESFRIARVILKRRTERALLQSTTDLKTSVEEACGWRAPSILPQVFQALRIKVNDELGALDRLLAAGPAMLRPNGRLGIISYHSLEDRMVKQAFKTLATAPINETTGQDLSPAPFELLTKKALVPSDEEIAANPRSRSAKFRAIRRA